MMKFVLLNIPYSCAQLQFMAPLMQRWKGRQQKGECRRTFQFEQEMTTLRRDWEELLHQRQSRVFWPGGCWPLEPMWKRVWGSLHNFLQRALLVSAPCPHVSEGLNTRVQHSAQTHTSVLDNKGILHVGWQMESSHHISHSAEKPWKKKIRLKKQQCSNSVTRHNERNGTGEICS